MEPSQNPPAVPSTARPRAEATPQPSSSSTHHGIKMPRAIASGFDGLVRSIRSRSASTPGIARRVLELWKEVPEARLQVDALRLDLDGEPGLSAEETDGRWLLPAYMAGLRSLHPHREATLWDVSRLAEELCVLEPDPESLASFRDWLWCHGSTGFDIESRLSFLEIMESSDSHPSWEEWAGRSMDRLREAVRRGAGGWQGDAGVDVASLRRSFLLSLATFQREAAAGHRDLDEARRGALKEACDRADTWAAAEMDTIQGHPGLMAMIRPERLARRIVGILETRCDLRLVGCLLSLAESQDECSMAVLGQLEGEPVGDLVARRIGMDEAGVSVLKQCLARAPRHVASGLVHGLLRRAAEDEGFAGTLGRVAGQGTADRMLSLLDAAKLSEIEARVLSGMMCGNVRGGIGMILRLAAASPPGPRCALLAGLPARALSEQVDTVKRALAGTEPQQGAPLLAALAAARDPSSLDALGTALAASCGRGWRPKLLLDACEALVTTGAGCDVLVQVARSSQADTETRLAALRSLERRPELLKKVSRWSLREALVYPDEVKERLREVRRRSSGEEP